MNEDKDNKEPLKASDDSDRTPKDSGEEVSSEEKEGSSSEEPKGSDETNSSSEEGVVVLSDEQFKEGDQAKKDEEEPYEKSDKPVVKKKVTENKKEKAEKKNEKVYLPDFPYDFKTVMAVLLSLTAVVLIWFIVFHPSMRISTIEVNGNYEFTDQQIMDALDLHVGDHILKPTFGRANALRNSTPYIEDIDVHVRFPSRIVIEVTERHKLAYIKVPDGYAVIDAEGIILDFRTTGGEDVHPVLAGLELNSLVVGSRTDITESLKFRKLILVLGAVLDADRGSIRNDGYHFYDSVREIRIVSSGLIFLTVELPDSTVLQVKLAGVENIDENMQWLLYAIRADAFEGLPAGSLDMTEEEKIYRAYST